MEESIEDGLGSSQRLQSSFPAAGRGIRDSDGCLWHPVVLVCSWF